MAYLPTTLYWGQTTNVTFASAGTYAITATYTTTDTPKEIPKMSHPTDTIIESLFKLNPTVRKKYKGDAQKFADALIAAAKQIDGQKALSDLTDLGLTE